TSPPSANRSVGIGGITNCRRSTRPPRAKPWNTIDGTRIALRAWNRLTPYLRTAAARTMNSPNDAQIGTESLVDVPGPEIGPPRANPPAAASAAWPCAWAASFAAPVIAVHTDSAKSLIRCRKPITALTPAENAPVIVSHMDWAADVIAAHTACAIAATCANTAVATATRTCQPCEMNWKPAWKVDWMSAHSACAAPEISAHAAETSEAPAVQSEASAPQSACAPC